jgi:hypothetical protein
VTLHRSAADSTIAALAAPNERAEDVLAKARAWIFVFDIDRDSTKSPRPLRIVQRVTTTATALLHQAFTAASARGIEAGVIDRFRATLASRIRSNWKTD